jgi:RNA polymerase sigma factor (sigma-70 family)
LAEEELCTYLISYFKPIVYKRLSEADISEDVLNEALIKTINTLRDGKLKNERAVKDYINKIMTGNIVDAIRERQKEREIFTTTIDDYVRKESEYKISSDGVHRKLNPEREMQEKELIKKLLQRAHLTPIEKDVIIDFYIHGKTKEEIMEERRWNEKKFNNTKHRALEKMKTELPKFV